MKKKQQKKPGEEQKDDRLKKSAVNNDINNDGSILFDLPEVKDIPGQENIRPPRIREMMDTTASSAGEEGEGLLDDINKEEQDNDIISDSSNVSEQEKKLLAQSDRLVNEEEIDRLKLSLDNSDGEDPLNEKANPLDLGVDLDVNGGDEEPGEEDEENNVYSRVIKSSPGK